jgi:hypothetical protein
MNKNPYGVSPIELSDSIERGSCEIANKFIQFICLHVANSLLEKGGNKIKGYGNDFYIETDLIIKSHSTNTVSKVCVLDKQSQPISPNTIVNIGDLFAGFSIKDICYKIIQKEFELFWAKKVDFSFDN